MDIYKAKSLDINSVVNIFNTEEELNQWKEHTFKQIVNHFKDEYFNKIERIIEHFYPEFENSNKSVEPINYPAGNLLAHFKCYIQNSKL